jgi:hypothetical protein
MHNPPAFPLSFVAHPTEETFVAKGMTLRDYFAAKAMQGIVNNSDAFWAGAAPLAYQYADAMMKVRSE